MEVVVNKHAEQTTTSEKEDRPGIITISKQKLTTHENSDRYKQSTPACSTTTVQTAAKLDDIVIWNSLTTMFTASAALKVEVGAKRLFPSSFEIPFPPEQQLAITIDRGISVSVRGSRQTIKNKRGKYSENNAPQIRRKSSFIVVNTTWVFDLST